MHALLHISSSVLNSKTSCVL